jgi:Glycosyl hydrolases family 15/Phosphorylase b kinase C-terminal domain
MKQAQLLERLYAEVETVILSRQHPVTGLLPASTAVNNHGDYTDAWVRDNVYSIMSVWALGIAFKRDGQAHRADHLEQSTIKLMRGLLQSMMRQSSKVEAFKYSLDNKDSLHAKYDTSTGLPVVADDAWGHLQIDATSLYLLMLAQMSASGLRIVCTPDEVDFVQNLVYYISSAYRTPDYGIWERGNKVNNGKTEINASSVGMAKAALQALDGFNLFGANGDKRGVIHVIADAISLARTTLASLLPRESLSKETDSALLSIIGFPAFAVGKESLATQTRDTVLTKLGGNYGCKRFLWDGHQTALEESSRIYYNLIELVNFANIESEWPLFFTYLYITALFDGSEATARYYRKKLESLMVNVDGVGLLPELYYLPKENVEEEKKNPRSQPRVPNDNLPLVWAQSLFYTGLLLDEGLVRTDDLDPLKMRRRSTKFIKSNIALVVLAENDQIKQHLAKNGVIAESLQDIKPMAVVSASGLMEAYAHVGENKALGLTGRPRRRVQSLATSQTYEINNKIYLCLSWMQSEREDYRLYDAVWVSQSLEQEIHFIYKNWLSSEVAIFTIVMDHRLCKIPNADLLLKTLHNLQLRTDIEYVGYASANLAYRASRVNKLSIPYFHVHSVTNNVLANFVGDESIKPEQLEPVAKSLLENFYTESDIFTYRKFSNYVNKHNLDDVISIDDSNITVRDLIRDVYLRSQKTNYWLLARFCFSQFNYTLIDLSDSLTLLAARNLIVSVGDNDYTEIKIDQSFSNTTYFESVRQLFPDLLERTLVQEILSAIGSLIRAEPALFDGLHSVQLRNFMLLCSMDKGDAEEVSLLEWLGLQSPAKIYNKIRNILSSRKHVFSQEINYVAPYKIHQHDKKIDENPLLPDTNDTDWQEWRTSRGLLTHFDKDFLKDIWHSLMFCDTLVFGNPGGNDIKLDCEITRSSMTPGEVSFAHLIDRVTHQLYPHYYKAAVIEALYAFTQFCVHNPQVRFVEPLVFKDVIQEAAKRYVDERLSSLKKRSLESDLTVFLQQSPHILNLFVTLVYADLTKPY